MERRLIVIFAACCVCIALLIQSNTLSFLQLDTDDTGSLVLYGGGAIAALWLTSAVIGAIDSIPVVCNNVNWVNISNQKPTFLNANVFWFILVAVSQVVGSCRAWIYIMVQFPLSAFQGTCLISGSFGCDVHLGW